MEHRYVAGDRVRVRVERSDGNPRTPHYLRGQVGIVVRCHGVVDNPLDHREPYPPLYSIVFPLGRDQVLADLHEEWLEPA